MTQGGLIETERLLLRVPQAQDRAPLHTMWADPLVMADLGPVKTAADSDAALARHDAYRSDGLGFLAVVLREGGETIGFCGLKPGNERAPIAGELEAGWLIARDHWGRGYAGEAVVAAIERGWAHHDATRVVAITARRNDKSRRVMEKLGFVHRAAEDFLHPDFPADDERRDTVVYALARPA